MEPQRRYTQKVKKAFHISMASLDVSTSSEEPAQVMVGFEGRNYLLCTLRKPDLLQCALDLNFEVSRKPVEVMFFYSKLVNESVVFLSLSTIFYVLLYREKCFFLKINILGW